MRKSLGFILESIIIYTTLGLAINTTTQVALKHTYIGRTLVFIGFFLILNRLVRNDKQRNIKLFKCINIAYVNLFITFAAMFFIEIFHVV